MSDVEQNRTELLLVVGAVLFILVSVYRPEAECIKTGLEVLWVG
jgi:hypothetical protein